MKKEELLKDIREASHKNNFSLVLERSSIGDEKSFENSVRELQDENKIKIREYSKKDNVVNLIGFLKYASE
ncbi:hypothetical protein [Priestia megaterium]|uniref:Uncharacterized protein n=1 Tax=Priestia megaterium TaxID=1404 RepID=A0A6M6E6K9_PRIMG|nr:hypothetical protein [Priestia megaterium]QJX80228.1 hypothetical protein FDZ14_29465 [Priestia megaterium]